MDDAITGEPSTAEPSTAEPSTAEPSTAERVAAVRARIAAAAARAGRPVADVTLVAVTKTHSLATVRAVLGSGVVDLGENRAQELVAKAAELASDPVPGGVRWHFVGQVQRNKVRLIADTVALWHGVDRIELGDEIARRAPGAAVLVEVNVGEEPQKGGVAPEQTAGLVDGLRTRGLDVRGLMCVPPVGADPRPAFAELRGLAERLGLAELSMGMSGDYEVAIEEGATIVRVGTAITGPRR